MSKAVLDVSLPGLRRIARGKVRDIFEAEGGLVMVSTDRLSAFDVIQERGIPGRGIVLTELSEFWFRGPLNGLCAHHLITTDLDAMPDVVQAAREDLAGRTMFVNKVDIVPVECVVRGYLAGSGWKEYQRSSTVCGVPLPAGLRNSEKLPEPIFTPTTKAETDEPMTFAEVEQAIGAELAARLRDTSLAAYARAADHAAKRGILLADTKFEFGLRNGELVLADEVLTPDSSRYWDVETYEPGRNQDSFDKQIVRDWLEQSDWNKKAPGPAIPDEIIERTAGRYREIMRRLMDEEKIG